VMRHRKVVHGDGLTLAGSDQEDREEGNFLMLILQDLGTALNRLEALDRVGCPDEVRVDHEPQHAPSDNDARDHKHPRCVDQAGVEQKTRHRLHQRTSLARQHLARFFHHLGSEWLYLRLGHRNQQSTSSYELDSERCGFQFDSAVAPAYLQRQPRPKPGLASDLLRNHQSAGRINGSFHATNVPDSRRCF